MSSPDAPPQYTAYGTEHHGSTRSGRRRRNRGGRGSREKPEKRSFFTQPWFIAFSFILAFAAAGWMTWLMVMAEQRPRISSSASRERSSGTERIAVTPEVANSINAAFRDMASRESFAAYRKLVDVYETNPDVPGLLPLLYTFANKLEQRSDAERFIMAATKKSPESAEVNLLLARNAQISGSHDTALNAYENAHRADPLDPDILFLWGDALRRTGRNQAALEKFQAAMQRSLSHSGVYLTRIKAGLAEMETNPEMATARRKSQKAPDSLSGEQAFLLAAAHLLDSEVESTAAALKSAKERMPREFFTYLMKDPLFLPVLDHPMVAGLLLDGGEKPASGNPSEALYP